MEVSGNYPPEQKCHMRKKRMVKNGEGKRERMIAPNPYATAEEEKLPKGVSPRRDRQKRTGEAREREPDGR